MDMTQSFENVIAWQKAHAFVLLVYEITRGFPDDERFGLTSQFRRAAVSIEANFAEGYKKLGKAEGVIMLVLYAGYFVYLILQPQIIA